MKIQYCHNTGPLLNMYYFLPKQLAQSKLYGHKLITSPLCEDIIVKIYTSGDKSLYKDNGCYRPTVLLFTISTVVIQTVGTECAINGRKTD